MASHVQPPFLVNTALFGEVFLICFRDGLRKWWQGQRGEKTIVGTLIGPEVGARLIKVVGVVKAAPGTKIRLQGSPVNLTPCWKVCKRLGR